VTTESRLENQWSEKIDNQVSAVEGVHFAWVLLHYPEFLGDQKSIPFTLTYTIMGQPSIAFGLIDDNRRTFVVGPIKYAIIE
jgi:hypothetical protein